MSEVNGPHFIEEFSYKRDVKNREQGVLLMTAAGGEQFGAPMSVNQLRALVEKLQRELES